MSGEDGTDYELSQPSPVAASRPLRVFLNGRLGNPSLDGRSRHTLVVVTPRHSGPFSGPPPVTMVHAIAVAFSRSAPLKYLKKATAVSVRARQGGPLSPGVGFHTPKVKPHQGNDGLSLAAWSEGWVLCPPILGFPEADGFDAALSLELLTHRWGHKDTIAAVMSVALESEPLDVVIQRRIDFGFGFLTITFKRCSGTCSSTNPLKALHPPAAVGRAVGP